MDTRQFLAGPELEQLYLQDKTNDCFQEPENIKLLLTHILNKNMGELTDSDLEIIDFCNARIHPDGFPEEKKLQFMHDKFDLIQKEKEKKSRRGNIRKIAACFILVLLGGLLAFGFSSKETEAGIFNWVRSLFVNEDEEQLIVRTQNTTQSKNPREFEMKEGHLPEKLPEGYVFFKSLFDNSSSTSLYQYSFLDTKNSILSINIKELHTLETLHQCEIELNNSSLNTTEKNHTTYYYATNNDNNIISWTKDLNVYIVSGDYSFEELERIISCYEEE